MKKSLKSLFCVLLITALILPLSVISLAYTPTYPFRDIEKDSWYEYSAEYCCSCGYINGTGAGYFSPGVKMSRAMAVSILKNIAENYGNYSEINTFSDVTADSWYHNAVEWAYDFGISSGASGGLFLPEATITRQDFICMLFRYYKIYSDTPSQIDYTKREPFFDAYYISDYANESINWALTNNILYGNMGYLYPTAEISRAEACSIIEKYDYLFGHDFKAEEVLAPYTCETYGEILLKCSHCDKERTVYTKPEHVWEQNTQASTSTCIIYDCLFCDCKKEVVIELPKIQPGLRTEGWDSNFDGKLTIDEYLGGFDVVDFLDANYSDYLGTPYESIRYNLYTPENLLHNIGQYPYDARMNCTGFVASVMSRCGANLGRILNSRAGAYCNAYNWADTIDYYGIYHYTFYSITDALNSGLLHKGNIILFMPSSSSGDSHMGFFCADTPQTNEFWHSAPYNSYTSSHGVVFHGNQITQLTSVSDYAYFYVLPMQGE